MVVPSLIGKVGASRQAQVGVALVILLVGAALAYAVHERATSPPSCLDRESPTDRQNGLKARLEKGSDDDLLRPYVANRMMDM